MDSGFIALILERLGELWNTLLLSTGIAENLRFPSILFVIRVLLNVLVVDTLFLYVFLCKPNQFLQRTIFRYGFFCYISEETV